MKRLMLAVGLMTCCLSGTALAQMGPRGPELEGLDHGHLMMLMRIAQLSDDQKAQAHQIMKDAREQSKPMVQQIRSLKQQLAERMIAPGALQLSDLAPLRQQIRDLQIEVDDRALGAMMQDPQPAQARADAARR